MSLENLQLFIPKRDSQSSQDFGEFASLIPEAPRGLSPAQETKGGAALLYPTGKRKSCRR
jgi:hypothetical protein